MVAAAAHNDDFWHDAYREHAPAVLAFLRRRIGAQEAEDVLQETFVRAIRADSFRAGGNARAYLLSTARHLLINRGRRPRRVFSEDALGGFENPLDSVPGSGASPEEDTAWRAFEKRLASALDELADAHRRAFELAVLEQRSYAEVAATAGWSLPQVKINVYRARKRLTELLAEDLPTFETPSPGALS